LIRRTIAFVLLVFVLNFQSTGQQKSNQLLFDFSLRYRFEAWQGMNAKNYGDASPEGIGNLNDNILYQRIITGFRYQAAKNLELGLHMQDARAFGWSLRQAKLPDIFKVRAKGTETPFYVLNPGEDFLEIYDAYIMWQVKPDRLKFKIGRQKIFYGDSHVFGPGNWGNTGRWTWDAARVSYSFKKHFIDVFAGGTKTLNPIQTQLPFVETEFWGGGTYAHFEWTNGLTLEPFYALKMPGSAPYVSTLNFQRHWLGVRFFKQNLHHFLFDFTYVRQFGFEGERKTSAYGCFAKMGYQFVKVFGRPLISLRSTYGSGGSDSDQLNRTFDFVYGAGDKYYGWMNITKWSNLDDREIVLEWWPLADLWVELKWNRFYIPATENFKLLNTMQLQAGSHHLGDEVDLFVKYQYNSHWQWIAATGYFRPGTLENIAQKPAKNAYWLSLQLMYQL